MNRQTLSTPQQMQRCESVDGAPDGDWQTPLYRRLKQLASRQRRSAAPSADLCTTELVHETYLRMSDVALHGTHAGQFYAYAARAMRHTLADACRHESRRKRGGDQARIAFDDGDVESVPEDYGDVLHLDRALRALEVDEPRAARVLELHVFGGLALTEIAAALGVTARTAERDWRYARLFLAAYVGPG